MRFLLPLMLLGLLPTLPSAAAEVDFARDVLPIIQNHCIDCHGPDEQESKLRLDSMLAVLAGGDSGERVIVPGQSDAKLSDRVGQQRRRIAADAARRCKTVGERNWRAEDLD